MNKATLQLVLEARDLASPALERLRAGAWKAGQEGGRAARGLDGLNRAGKGLAPAAETMERLQGALREMANDLPQAANTASRAFDDLRRNALEPGLRSMSALRRGAGELRSAMQGAPPGMLAASAVVQRFNHGGLAFQRLPQSLITRGSGTADDVPAMLMRGEYVLRKEAVARYGLDFLHALNTMQLPAMSFTAVPRFAAGGMVVPPQFMDIIPRFASGGQVGGFASTGYTADRFLASARPLQEIMEEFKSKVEKTAGRIGLTQLKDSPAEYLSGALGIVTDTIEVFKKTPMTIPEAITTTGNASEELEAKKQLLKQEYQQKIDLEKSRGNDAIANALEMQALELTDMIAGLQMLLEDLAYSYRQAVENAALDAEAAIEELYQEYQAERLTIQDRYDNIRPGTAWHGHIALQNRFNIMDSKLRRLDRKFYSDVAREERKVEADIRFEDRTLDREARKALREVTMEGVSAEKMGALGLRELYQEYEYSIQEMEAEFALRLQELFNEYGNVNVSGFKHWLSKGGPVGFASGGAVPRFPWADPHRDSVPAMLTPGEFVLRKEAVQALGAGMLERLNSLGDSLNSSLRPVLAFAQGGVVPGGSLSGQLQPAAPPTAHGDWGSLNITIGGAGGRVLAEREVAKALRKALHKQTRVSG